MGWAEGDAAEKKAEEETAAEFDLLRPELAALVQRGDPTIMLSLLTYYAGMLIATHPMPDARKELLENTHEALEDSVEHFCQRIGYIKQKLGL